MHGPWITDLVGSIAVSILFYKGIVLHLRHDVYKTTKIVKYIAPWSGVQVLGRGQYSITAQNILVLENRYQIYHYKTPLL